MAYNSVKIYYYGKEQEGPVVQESVEDLILSEKAAYYLEIGGDGIATNITVKQNTEVTISENGIIIDCVLEHNSSNDNLAGILTLFGGEAYNVTVSGSMRLSQGTTGTYITVLDGGAVRNSRGNIANVTVADGGYLRQTYGSAVNVVINNGGKLVAEGTSIAALELHKGSIVTFGAGVSLQGTVCIGQELSLYEDIDASEATVDFLLDERSTEDNSIISDWSLCAFGACNITVSANQEYGIYKLAENAGSFGMDTSLQLDDGTYLGTLSLGRPMISGENYYMIGYTETGTLAFGVDECNYIVVEFDTPGSEIVSIKSATAAVSVYAAANSQVYAARRKASESEWSTCEVFGNAVEDGSQLIELAYDMIPDVIMPEACGVWSSGYVAKNTNTGVCVGITGMNRYDELVWADGDTTAILFSDGDDAIFADDVFTAVPDEVSGPFSRFCNITAIYAGAGNDIVDLTMLNADDANAGIVVRGGEGDDILWGGNNGAILHGDEGNDILVGGKGDDILVGGEGDDYLNGCGGNDIFYFGDNWGHDTVEQLAGENDSVTLCFSGSNDDLSLTFVSSGDDTIISSASGDSIIAKNLAITLDNCRFGMIIG